MVRLAWFGVLGLWLCLSSPAALAQDAVPPAAPAQDAAPPPALVPDAAVPPPVLGQNAVPPPAPGPQLTATQSLPPPVAAPAPVDEPKKDPPWYERIKIRGYTQFRYNRLPSFEENDKLVNAQGDRTIGGANGFSIRRARVILYGDIHERISIYLQTDFASVINDQLNVAIMRDWYADIFLDKQKQLRLRVGQSKVPYGFENLQSSQNRLALDRSDATNSGVKDERDIGVFAYWAPKEIRARFKHLVDSGLKGSGDYGVVGLGVYNGQTANRPALSDDMHVVGRVTYPFQLGEQFLELGAGGYYGKFYVSTTEGGSYTLPEGGKIEDARAIASVMLYPQPFGFAAEGTYGVGPSQGERGAADRDEIRSRKLYGGYAQVMFKVDDLFGTVALIPYARATYYDGGKKFETNAPHYVVKELELGVEWQILKALELVAAYDIAERTYSKAPYQQERGHITRVQLQVNY
jgi:hypothetical protein